MFNPRAFLFLAAACLLAGGAWAHPGLGSHDHVDAAFTLAQAQPATAGEAGAEQVSGQGDLKFRVFATSSELPKEALAVLVSAHGGFAVDRREGQGEVYFALPGAGILQISPDLKQCTIIPTEAEVRDTNLHNTNIWYAKDGTPYLSFPANSAGKVFTTTLDGKLVNTLEPPTDVRFDEDKVVQYFADGGKFVPTDVEFLKGLYYVTTGYSDLDYVLTANVTSDSPVQASWNSALAFGGKGAGPGQFGTGHGVTVSPDEKVINIADRPNSEIDRFTPEGKYTDTVKLPAGSLPCDIDFESGYVAVGCLEGPDKTLGAPIYIVKDDAVVSTVMPKEDLGLTNFAHIHNAVMVSVGGKFYLIAQAWNPGDFAILEQVK